MWPFRRKHPDEGAPYAKAWEIEKLEGRLDELTENVRALGLQLDDALKKAGEHRGVREARVVALEKKWASLREVFMPRPSHLVPLPTCRETMTRLLKEMDLSPAEQDAIVRAKAKRVEGDGLAWEGIPCIRSHDWPPSDGTKPAPTQGATDAT